MTSLSNAYGIKKLVLCGAPYLLAMMLAGCGPSMSSDDAEAVQGLTAIADNPIRALKCKAQDPVLDCVVTVVYSPDHGDSKSVALTIPSFGANWEGDAFELTWVVGVASQGWQLRTTGEPLTPSALKQFVERANKTAAKNAFVEDVYLRYYQSR